MVAGSLAAVTPRAADATGPTRQKVASSAATTKKRLAAPRTVLATFHPKARTVTITWSKVGGATAYHVAAFAAAVAGPQVPHTVKAPKQTFTIAYKNLPKSATGGFRFAVSATGNGSVSESTYTNLEIASLKQKEVKKTAPLLAKKRSTLDKATAVAKGCLKDGLSVGVGTAAAGSPFVLFGVAIPGVGEVTAAGLGAVASFTGGSATLACVAGHVL